jgi:hypothetical protein
VRPQTKRFLRWLRGDPRTPPSDLPVPEPAKPLQGRIGICCSGGGIRSAAYSLGGLGVLRDAGLFRCIDEHKRPLVSAVSGGSYIASSFATVATSIKEGDKTPVYAANSPEERHLRNNSSYMAPGFGGKVRLVARVVLGMLPNIALVGLALFVCGWLLGGFWTVAVPDLGKHLTPDTTTWARWAGYAAALGVIIILPDLLFRVRDTVSARMQTLSIRALVVSLAILVVLVALPHAVAWIRDSPDQWIRDLSGRLPLSPDDKSTVDLLKQLNVVALLGTMLSAAWTFIARRGKLVALAVGTISGPLAVGIPVVIVAERVSVGGVSPAEWRALGVALAVAALVWVFVDLNQWSLNPFYRRRLSTAFFVRRDAEGHVHEQPFKQRLRFSHLQTGDRFPQLVVCAAANVSDVGVTPPGRRATPFRFSKEAIGGPLVKTRPASEYEEKASMLGRDATLPAAVSVSGAAVSPTMGRKTLRAFTMLLTLTNVRLGVWLPNPARLPDTVVKKTWRTSALAPLRRALERRPLLQSWIDWLGARRPGPQYLFKEMLGRTRISDRYLYVTDGGHYDNLGLVELLRAGCTTIFCLDGGGDRAGSYQALGEAVALARSELGVDVEIDPLAIVAPKKKEFAPTDHVIGRIRYRGTTGEAPGDGQAGDEGTGLLVYCRAAVTADAPWDVRDFRERDPRFPIHSTLDQLFNDEKFESYRALGAWTARRALTTWQRRVVLDAIRRELIERASKRATVRHSELVAEVMKKLRHQFSLGDKNPEWAPANLFPALLDELKAAEENAQRPALVLVVQERRPGPLVKRALTPVWDYWAPSTANGARSRRLGQLRA